MFLWHRVCLIWRDVVSKTIITYYVSYYSLITYSDFINYERHLPTVCLHFGSMKRKCLSKPGTLTVGNVTAKIDTCKRPTAIGKKRTVCEVSDYTALTRKQESLGTKDRAEPTALLTRLGGFDPC